MDHPFFYFFLKITTHFKPRPIMNYFALVCFLFFTSFFPANKTVCAQDQPQKLRQTETTWIISEFLQPGLSEIKVSGQPNIVDSPYGQAVYFDGIDDALFVDSMPLAGLSQFTVEMIFCPDSAQAPFEQRMLHIGEDKGDRMLLELRAVDGNWYFDGYAATGNNKKALIDEQLLHPLGEWSHVAFVVTTKSLTTFVNGKRELSEDFSFQPIQTGATSIGTRIDKRSWFKGAIYQVRISPKALSPGDFLTD
jgi:hypothetical protein